MNRVHTKRQREEDVDESKPHHTKSGFQNIWDGTEEVMSFSKVRKFLCYLDCTRDLHLITGVALLICFQDEATKTS